MPAPRFVLDDFWPSDLFLGGIPGAWYDPTDLSTMFQDSAGTTPVTAVEQPVGLIFDKSQGLALGAELVTNGTFDVNLNGWTLSGTPSPTWSASGIVLTSTGAFFTRADQSFSTTVGRTYRLTFDVVTGSGSLAVKIGTSNGASDVLLIPNMTTAGARSFVFVAASATTYIRLENGSVASPVMDNISVRELAGNHASQSTAASRPTYRARYNLLTYSEQFNDASWTKQSTTISTNTTVAPDGTTTADTLVETATNALHLTYQTLTAVIGARYTFSCYAKAAQRSYVALQIYNNVSNARFTALFDLIGGTVVTTRASNAPTGTSSSITSVGNGWWRIQITMDQVGGTQNIPQIALSDSATPTFAADLPSYLGDGTSGAYIWGAQLLTAADVTATGNAYQRIAAATVYDTAPIFRPYLAFDGVDDSLSTAAINFTSTDKMTVFGGVTKFVDAIGVITELSADKNANNGVFFFNTDTAPRWYWTSKGTVEAGANSGAVTTFPAPSTSVVTNTGDISAPLSAMRVNGVFRTSSALTQGTGNYGNYPLFIGRRNNASLPFNGRLFSLIVRGAASSVTEIADTELWVNARTGGY